jgi:hypothetical protein
LRMHYRRMGRDDGHGYAPLTRFLGPDALAQCEVTDAVPPVPLMPQVAKLAASVDAELDALWA